MITLYHGSPYKFKNFDYTKIGKHATSEGYGFYFTNNKEIATNYAEKGYLYTVSFDGRKSLSSKKKTITKPMLKKFLSALHDVSEEEEFLSNFDDIYTYGTEKVLNDAVNLIYNYNNNDVDMISEICNVWGGKEPLTILYEVLNYDHIQVLGEWSHNEDENMIYIAIVDDIINITKIEEF